ncbi:Het-C-domain-containing protein [Mycena vitilis]|nr:Het-C-domain-containing protein [Mycena vitilis]
MASLRQAISASISIKLGLCLVWSSLPRTTMSGSQNFATTLLLITLVVILLPETVHAFGAGDIPDFAFLNDKAFRHGDIENILSTLAKSAGHAAAANANSDNLFGFAKNLIKSATSGPGGPKFSSGDIKKVYFGNWLRDYSQAMDIGGLSKLTADSLVLVVSVLGFMTFGFATEEFQVTAERLGVYLPVEHIDNPKGYGEKEGDPRRFHPKLRPPVNPRELEIDQRTGMKVSLDLFFRIPSSCRRSSELHGFASLSSLHAVTQLDAASENQGWDTSTAHIRRVLTACIETGRRARSRDGPELYEAYRLLGTGLHTLEDLLAHSNWVEIALRKMGHSQVFCHVGDATEIETPGGRAPPLVTGTFGGADFLHSLMGEAGDKLSQASVTDLASKMNDAQNGDNSNVSALKSILSKLPIGGGDSKMDEGEQLHAEAKAYNFDPDNVAPPEVQQKLLQLLKWRDGLMRSILEKIEMIPGLDSLMDQLSNALNAYVYTVIAPWITPLLQQATSVLGEGSKAVINSEDQYEVFDNPRASDPSHSLLSKDHFGLILNEPAGKIAMLVVEHSVKIIVQAWSDNSNPSQAVDVILEAFHHPYYATGRSGIQTAMFQAMERWLGGLGEDEARQTIDALTKDSVRNGKNKRLGSENEDFSEAGYGGCGHGAVPQRRPQEQQQQQSYGGGGQQYGGETQYPRNESGRNEYSSGNDEHSRGSQRTESYRQSEGGRNEYSSNNEYSRGSERTESYGQAEEYGGSRRNEESEQPRHGHHHKSHRHDNDEAGESYQRTESSGYAPAYTQPVQEERYSGSSGYGRASEEPARREYESRDESASYGRDNSSRSAGYGRSEEQTYGGDAARSGYGRNEEASAYASAGRGSSGYGRSEEPAYESSAGRGASGYGRAEESEYGRGEERGGGYGREEQSGYGREEQSEYGRAEEPAYGTSRGQEYGQSDETFGAERLNINEEQGYGGEREQGYGREQKYGRRNEYESNY